MAYPTYQAKNTNTSAGTSASVNLDGGGSSGDVYICCVSTDGNGTFSSLASGWTEFTASFPLSDGTCTLGVFWAEHDTATNFSATISSSEVWIASLVRISGASTSAPISGAATTTGSGANTSAPAGTTDADDSLLLRVISVDRDNVTAAPTTSVYALGGGGAQDVGQGISYENGPATAGSYSASSAFTHASDGTARATLEIQPPSTEDVLSADDVATAVPTVSSPALGQIHGLLADDVSTAVPTASSPAVGQVHILLADDIATDAPTASSPVASHIHVLLADNLATGPPTASSPAIGQTHVLLADDIATAVPTVSSPAIGQTHVLLADDVATAVPTVSSPVLAEAVTNLLADDIATAAPTVSSPVLTEVTTATVTWVEFSVPDVGGTDVLLADDIVTDAPTVSSPVLAEVTTATVTWVEFSVPDVGGTDVLLADDIATAVPTVSSPALGQEHVLLADDVSTDAPTVSSPALGQEHVLLADDISTDVPTVSSPALAENVAVLLADDIATAVPTVSSPALGQVHVLLADDIATDASTVSTSRLFTEEPTASITARAWISHACAIREVPDVVADQETMDEWGPSDTHLFPWDHPAWLDSRVHYGAACIHGNARIGADVVTKTGRASIVATAAATGIAATDLGSSGTVILLRWN